MEPEDLDFLYGIENDRELWDIGETNVPYSRYLLKDYIANTVCDIYTDKQLRLIIENCDSEAVGIIDLINFEPRHSRAEVGIVIKKEFRGKGYAKEAVQILINYARDILHLHQIYACSDVRNTVCISLFDSLGFIHSAVLRDWLSGSCRYGDAVLMQYFL